MAGETLPGWPHDRSPFHPGEWELQARAGLRERIEQIGRRVIRTAMPDQHRELFEKLPILFVGSLDPQSRLWASALVGPPGFIRSPDPWTLDIAARPVPGDPLAANLRAGAPIGLLGLEFPTRRRNRANGMVIEVRDGGFAVRVGQSFGNCPKYIHARTPEFAPAQPSASPPVTEGPVLSPEAVALIAEADTFFIATAAPHADGRDPVEGVDVSHRGGKPGFVRVTEEAGHSVLTSPDFLGNFSFNTFGNLARNPGAGLLFLDFTSGDVLSLTGRAEVLWDGPELAAFAGAQRLLRFVVEAGVRLGGALPLRWSAPEPAPQLAATGSWEEAEALVANAPYGKPPALRIPGKRRLTVAPPRPNVVLGFRNGARRSIADDK